MKLTPVGVDIAKNVFQVHWVDPYSGEIVSKRVKRAKFLEHFANREPCLIGMEACGGAHHWARQLTEMGHQVKLMPARFVKAFNIGNKNDPADARAIWLTVQQPGKAVAVKTEGQQAVLALHRMRQQLIKFRTMQINCLRGLLTEYGEVMGKGRTALDKAIPGVLATVAERLPAVLIDTLRDQWNSLNKLDEQISVIERRLREWMKQDKACNRIAAIPGIGLPTATAAVATMGDPKSFRSGREFAAWIGLVPRQTGSGGKVVLLGVISAVERTMTGLVSEIAHNAAALWSETHDMSFDATRLVELAANARALSFSGAATRTVETLHARASVALHHLVDTLGPVRPAPPLPASFVAPAFILRETLPSTVLPRSLGRVFGRWGFYFSARGALEDSASLYVVERSLNAYLELLESWKQRTLVALVETLTEHVERLQGNHDAFDSTMQRTVQRLRDDVARLRSAELGDSPEK